MTLAGLIALFRQETDDRNAPYLWDDPEVIDFAVDAENEACRRADLLIDASTAAICQIAVVGGTALYTLDSRVIEVRRAIMTGGTDPLTRRMLENMDADLPGWEATTSATVDSYVPNYQTRSVRLYPKPTGSGTLNLVVSRLPLADMDDPTNDSPEIAVMYHRNLRWWMLHRAYSKRDGETFDPQRSQEALAKFEAEFGTRKPAYEEEADRIGKAYQNSGGGY